jgi:polygalacturonase
MKKHIKGNLIFLIGIIGLILFFQGCQPAKNHLVQASDPEADLLYQNLPFDMPRVQEPVIPSLQVNILEFNARSGGEFNNTQAFADAIAAVTGKGGGRVVVPRGIWLTGPIIFKSNLNLHLENGAMIVFSTDFEAYPLLESNFEGLKTYRCISPIYGKGLENISITGNGVIDGSGDAWRFVKKSKMTDGQWKKLLASGGITNEKGDLWFPSESSYLGYRMSDNNVPELQTKEEHEKIKDFLRPVMVNFISCNKVLLDGPTFQNSPAWNIHPLMCENLIVRNITVRNPWYSQNGDGIDVESCKNVLVYNSTFDVGDDAICFKSGKGIEGRRRGMPTENAIVKNCIVYHGHGGFTVGSEMSGGVRNVQVTECTFIGTDVGLRFKSTRGRGGIVENIYISKIDMVDIPAEAIRFNLFYEGKSPIPDGDEPITSTEVQPEITQVTEETPQFRNIFIKDVVSKGAGQAVFLQGLPEMNLENFVLDGVVMEADKGITCVDATNITLKNIELKISNGPAISFYNAKAVDISNFHNLTPCKEGFAVVNGGLSNDIRFANTNLNTQPEMIRVSPELKEKKVYEIL